MPDTDSIGSSPSQEAAPLFPGEAALTESVAVQYGLVVDTERDALVTMYADDLSAVRRAVEANGQDPAIIERQAQHVLEASLAAVSEADWERFFSSDEYSRVLMELTGGREELIGRFVHDVDKQQLIRHALLTWERQTLRKVIQGTATPITISEADNRRLVLDIIAASNDRRLMQERNQNAQMRDFLAKHHPEILEQMDMALAPLPEEAPTLTGELATMTEHAEESSPVPSRTELIVHAFRLAVKAASPGPLDRTATAELERIA